MSGRNNTRSPSRIPSPTIESPLTRSRKSPLRCGSNSDGVKYSSACCTASASNPAGIRPTSGNATRRRNTGESSSATTRNPRAFPGSLSNTPFRSRLSTCSDAARGLANPQCAAISRIVGGESPPASLRRINASTCSCRSVSDSGDMYSFVYIKPPLSRNSPPIFKDCLPPPPSPTIPSS